MSIRLLLQSSGFNTYPWQKFKNICYRGYCDQTLLDAIDNNEDDFQEICLSLKEASHHYAIIKDLPEYLILAVDRIRSLPLFYTVNSEQVIVSDSVEAIVSNTDRRVSKQIAEEFLYTGYTTGASTLHPEIKQVQAGEVIIIEKNSKRLKSVRYFEYRHNNLYVNKAETDLFDILDLTHNRIFDKLIKGLNGRMAVVPLSGGYDSRLIAHLLRKHNYNNVLCFTYGHKHNKEVAISKEIAKVLGYKWIFIPYEEKDWQKNISSKEYIEYEKFAGNWSSLPHVQDWLAVKKLRQDYQISKDSVFIPGHANDFVAGSHTALQYIDQDSIKGEELIRDVVKKHYELRISPYTFLSKRFGANISRSWSNSNQQYFTAEQAVNEFDKWNWEERQAKFIANSVRVYEYFGFEWRLPYWEKDLIDFWLGVPINYRINRNLSINYSNRLLDLKGVSYFSTTSTRLHQVSQKIKSYSDSVMFRYIFNVGSALKNYTKGNNVLYGIIPFSSYILGSAMGKRTVNSFWLKSICRTCLMINVLVFENYF